jgi:hypothetical protein
VGFANRANTANFVLTFVFVAFVRSFEVDAACYQGQVKISSLDKHVS